MEKLDKKKLFEICNWLKQQPEYTKYPVDDKENLCWNVAPLTYARLILRYYNENIDKIEK